MKKIVISLLMVCPLNVVGSSAKQKKPVKDVITVRNGTQRSINYDVTFAGGVGKFDQTKQYTLDPVTQKKFPSNVIKIVGHEKVNGKFNPDENPELVKCNVADFYTREELITTKPTFSFKFEKDGLIIDHPKRPKEITERQDEITQPEDGGKELQDLKTRAALPTQQDVLGDEWDQERKRETAATTTSQTTTTASITGNTSPEIGEWRDEDDQAMTTHRRSSVIRSSSPSIVKQHKPEAILTPQQRTQQEETERELLYRLDHPEEFKAQ